MLMPRGKARSASRDFLKLCQHLVRRIKDLVKGKNLLNRRQCLNLSVKLSNSTRNIQELVVSPVLDFRPALEDLYLILEKAKLLVSECGAVDWCAAAIFQSHNENAFREILLAVGLCYNAIYEQARSCTSTEEWNFQVEDLRTSFMFLPASLSDVQLDNQDLEERLASLARGYTRIKHLHYFLPRWVVLQQRLAQYLLVKLRCTFKQSQAAALDTDSEILWQKDTEPPGTWGSSQYLGGCGVCRTEWLGIPCAKKEFHVKEYESLFLKEAGILAHLKHPCIVNFICCCNGEATGDRFIAMELMERSLSKVIEDQKSVPFALPVVVDIITQIARGMWYLHEQGVAHRDLKPQNVVVSRLLFPHLLGHFSVKLVDFGMSKTKVRLSNSNTISVPGVGTTMYRAPEVHPRAHPTGNGKATWFKADVFSFGMTCAQILSLKVPFKDMKALGTTLYSELLNGTRPELPSECPEELAALLRDCWATSPSLRPSFLEICTRLETYRQKMLRGFSRVHQDLPAERIEYRTGLDFIKMKMEEHVPFLSRPSVGSRDEVEEVILETEVHEPSLSRPFFDTSDVVLEVETYDSDEITSRNEVEAPPRGPSMLILANWLSECKDCRERIDQLAISRAKVKWKISYLVGFFSLLQGVVLTIALLHLGSSLCRSWRVLIIIWLLCTIVTLFGLCYKFYNIVEWKRATVEEFHCSKILMSQFHKLKRQDGRFDFSEQEQLEDDIEKKMERSLIYNRFFIFAWLVILVMLVMGSSSIIVMHRQRIVCAYDDFIYSTSSPTIPSRAPSPSPTAPSPAPTLGWSSFLTQAVFEGFFPDRVPFYTYGDFQTAGGAYSSFGTSGTLDDQKRELAAFLGNVKQMSGGLKFITEIDKSNTNCDATITQYPCAPGEKYYGRGPLLLSWNYNYGSCGAALGLNLLSTPDVVAQNSAVAYKTALWFWMTAGPHRSILVNSFSGTIRAINGAHECNQPAGIEGNDQMKNRTTFYKSLCRTLGVNPGTDLEC